MTSTLQQRIDQATPGEVVTLDAGPGGNEFQGPLRIDRPLTLDGHGATLWAVQGPLLTIHTDGSVRLKNLNLEITGDAEHEIALAVEHCDSFTLERVHTKGKVQGVDADTVWRYPRLVALRRAPGEESLPIEINAPEPFRLHWDLATIGNGETQYGPGLTRRTFTVPAHAAPGASLSGTLTILALCGERIDTIRVAGWVQSIRTIPDGDPDTTSGRDPSNHTGILLRACLWLLLPAGLVAFLVWHQTVTPPTLHVTITAPYAKPGFRFLSRTPALHVDFGTLHHSTDASGSRSLFVECAPFQPGSTNLRLLLYTVCATSNWISPACVDAFDLTAAVSQITWPLDFSAWQGEYAISGTATAIVMDGTNPVVSARISPPRITLSAQLRP